ncbi:MAG: hypothetical protein ABFS18_12980 [Thermodesulfobacteriota bacterium]
MRKIVMLCAISILLTSCGSDIRKLYTDDADTTSGDVGPFVETADIIISGQTSFYDGNDNEVRISLTFSRKDSVGSTRLRIGSTDRLMASVDGVDLPIHEFQTDSCSPNSPHCVWMYSYYFYLPENSDGKELTIAFERQIGISALDTRITIPNKPTFIQPVQGDVFYLSLDDLVLAWQPGVPGEYVLLDIRSDCGVIDRGFLSEPINSITFPAGSFERFSSDKCSGADLMEPVELTVFRYHINQDEVDPAFSSDSVISVQAKAQVSINSYP